MIVTPVVAKICQLNRRHAILSGIIAVAFVVTACTSRSVAPEIDTAPGSRASVNKAPKANQAVKPNTTIAKGGFYGGDRPPTRVPVNIKQVPNAQPMSLPLSKTGNKPYKALGKSYTPLKSAKGYRAKGVASWYGKKFHGRRTSSGETYDMFAMTAAHTVLPLPSFVRVTNLDNNKSVVVKVNDRGPFLHNRLIDLSYAAADRIGITKSGTGRVEVIAIAADSSEQIAASTTAEASSNAFTGVAGSQLNGDTQAAKYTLQIGSFSLADNAIGLRNWLRQKGYPVEPTTDAALIKLGPPYKVQSGPFSSIAEAQSARQSLQKLTRDKVILKTL